MELTVNGKTKELKFGIGFIRELDKIYKADLHGFAFGMGLTMGMAQLRQYNPTALSDVVRAAVKGNLSLQKVDELIEEYAEENDGLDSLFQEIIEEVGKSAVTKATLAKMTEAAENE